LKIAAQGNDPAAKESAQQALQGLGKGIVKK